LWITDDDVFQLRVDFPFDLGGSVEARIRVIGLRLVPEDYRLRATLPGAPTSSTVVVQDQAAAGFLQGAILTRLVEGADVDPSSTSPGQIYAQLTIGRFLPGAGYEHTLLCAGYVTARSSVGFPGGHTENVGDGAGWLWTPPAQSIAIAGGVLSFSAAAARMELIGGSVVLTVGAANAAKAPRMRLIDQNANVQVSVGALANVAPGGAQFFGWGQGYPHGTGADSRVQIPLPVNCRMDNNWVVTIETLPALQAGDSLLNGVIFARRWTT